MRRTGNNQSRRSAVRTARRGLSLFEVVLALAIFFGSFTAISEVLRRGSQAAIRAQFQSEAVIRCEAKMNELMGGVAALEPRSAEPFADNPRWICSVNIGDASVADLWRVETVVEHLTDRGEPDAAFRLVRLIRNPQVYFDAAAASTGTTP